MDQQQIENLADAFIAELRGALTKVEMDQVVDRNAAQADPDICHSQDFCDANVIMAAAFEKIGIEPPCSREGQGEEPTDLWNLAKVRKFRATLARDNKGAADREYSLAEAVADIAYIAGEVGFYGGDSRADVSAFIRLAHEFEDQFTQDAEDSGDYIEAVHSWAIEKLGIKNSEAGPTHWRAKRSRPNANDRRSE